MPSRSDKDNKIKQLGGWLSLQKRNYKNKHQIMSNNNIYNKWTELLNNIKYKKYFNKNNDI